MTTNWFTKTTPALQRLTPYQPGKSIHSVEQAYGLNDIIKLASNENPLGASSRAIQAAQQALENCALYPDSDGLPLRMALSKHLDVEPHCLVLGAGSDQILAHIAQAFVSPGQGILISEYAFATYRLIAEVLSAEAVIVPAQQGSHDLAAMAQAINENTRLIFIANPNNPTGTCCNHQALLTLLKKTPPEVVVILDEAYYEYACHDPEYPQSLLLAQQFSNLVITRTFSKAYGLAGLRIGYGFMHPTMVEVFNRIRLPFHVCTPALAAGLAALDDQHHLNDTLSTNDAGRMQLQAALTTMKVTTLPSHWTNFITLKLGEKAQKINELLLRQGIIVRPLLDYGLAEHLRVTIGTPLQNERFINALEPLVDT